MKLIPFTPKDGEVILPYLSKMIEMEDLKITLDPFTYKSGIVEDKNKVIAVGILRLINEWKLIVNPKSSNYQIAKAIKLLTEQALKESSTEIHAIIDKGGEKYIELLKRHFNFREPEGSFLRMEK